MLPSKGAIIDVGFANSGRKPRDCRHIGGVCTSLHGHCPRTRLMNTSFGSITQRLLLVGGSLPIIASRVNSA